MNQKLTFVPWMMNQKLSFLGCALGERALPESLRSLVSQLTRANPSNYYPVPPKIIHPPSLHCWPCFQTLLLLRDFAAKGWRSLMRIGVKSWMKTHSGFCFQREVTNVVAWMILCECVWPSLWQGRLVLSDFKSNIICYRASVQADNGSVVRETALLNMCISYVFPWIAFSICFDFFVIALVAFKI